MDEVDIIQNFLLSQAGEHTDVILGLGYDNSLGAKLGITLIATGFDHKDPFTQSSGPKMAEKKEEKIVMVLGETPKPAPAPVEKPLMTDPLAPVLNVDNNSTTVAATELFSQESSEAIPEAAPAEEPTILQLKLKDESLVDQEKRELEEKKKKLDDQFEILRQNIIGSSASADTTSHPSPAASGGYLARPSNIYAESKPEVSTSHSAGKPVPPPAATTEEQETFDMQLVIRNDIPAADAPTYQAQLPTNLPAEDTAPQDVAGEEKRKAAERLQKLRNLSFNINAADPNNEFEAVPAYIRRNMELFNNASTVENFYSNYTVEPEANNGAKISTINTFLDGKKPD
jgi:cell division protein FtsZ